MASVHFFNHIGLLPVSTISQRPTFIKKQRKIQRVQPTVAARIAMRGHFHYPDRNLTDPGEDPMKVVAINGSPRKGGNTSQLIRLALEELEAEGVETELVEPGAKHIKGCIACYKCFENKDGQCSVKDDMLNEIVGKMAAADGIILGSPTYFSNVSSNMKSIIDRAGLVAKANGELFQRKVGAAVVAVRRAGGIHVFNSINHFFLIGQMIVPGSSYWNVGIGREKGEVQNDDEGVNTMRNLGRNMAWLLKKLAD
jgi:multimeric flavodoxin WrbA